MFDERRQTVPVCAPERQGITNLKAARPRKAARVGGICRHYINALGPTVGGSADHTHAKQPVELHRCVGERVQIARARGAGTASNSGMKQPAS